MNSITQQQEIMNLLIWSWIGMLIIRRDDKKKILHSLVQHPHSIILQDLTILGESIWEIQLVELNKQLFVYKLDFSYSNIYSYGIIA